MWLFTRGWMGRAFDVLFGLFLKFPLKTLVLPLVVFWLLVIKSDGEHNDVDMVGRALIPIPVALAYYAVFFFFGWALHRCRESLSDLAATWQVIVHAVTIPALVVLFFVIRMLPLGWTSESFMRAFFFLYSIYTWSMIFLSIGLMLKWFRRRRAWAEYMADASYWFYWAHLPMVIALQVLVARWETNGLVKCLWIVGVTSLALWPMYQLGVRYTWVGRVMNGARARPNVSG